MALENFPPALRPLLIEKEHNGGIVVLWRDETTDSSLILSRHGVDNHTITGRSEVKLKRPMLLPLRNGDVLITEEGPSILRFPVSRDSPEIIRIPADALQSPPKRNDGSIDKDHYPVRAYQDHKGVIWLWSQANSHKFHKWRVKKHIVTAVRQSSFPAATARYRS